MLLEQLQLGGDISAPGGELFLGELLGLDALLEVGDFAHARKFVGVLESCRHLVGERFDALCDARVGLMDGPFALFDVAAVEETLLRLAELCNGRLAERHGSQHVLFGNLLGTCLDHRDVIGRAGDDQVEVGVLLLFVRRIADEVARRHVAADAHAGARAVKRGVADHQRSRSAHDADVVDWIDLVCNERCGNDMHFALEALGEAGANRTVDHACSQRALLGRTRLALEVTARDATDGVHFLDVVDGQREEVVILFLAGDDSCHEHGGVALADEYCAGRLLGELARLETVLLAVKFELLNDFFHCFLYFLFFLFVCLMSSFDCQSCSLEKNPLARVHLH